MSQPAYSNSGIDRIPAVKVTSGNYVESNVRDILAERTVKNVCDIACGNGAFTATLETPQGGSLVGVDGSLYNLDQAKVSGFVIHRLRGVDALTRRIAKLRPANFARGFTYLAGNPR